MKGVAVSLSSVVVALASWINFPVPAFLIWMAYGSLPHSSHSYAPSACSTLSGSAAMAVPLLFIMSSAYQMKLYGRMPSSPSAASLELLERATVVSDVAFLTLGTR